MSNTSRTRFTRMLGLSTLLGALALSGCASRGQIPRYAEVSKQGAEQLGVSEVELASVDPAFRTAVATYGTRVHEAKEFEGTARDAAVFGSIQSLADAVETIPRAPQLDLGAVASRIRGTQPTTALGFASELDQIETHRQSLEAAATALAAAAAGPYLQDEKVQDEVAAFQQSVRDIGETGSLRGRHERVVAALEKGRGALEAILVAEARRARRGPSP